MKLRLSQKNIKRAVSAALAAAALTTSIAAAAPAHGAPAAPPAAPAHGAPAAPPAAPAAPAKPAAPAAPAAPSAPGPDATRVLARAQTWTKQAVPYSQARYKGGYRTDCSGFVSMAWDLPENVVTWNIPLIARPIAKGELRAGDVLLNASGGVGGRHVVLFEKWADAGHTSYVALEQTGQVDKAVRRVMPYPYRIDGNLYKPYRYAGMDAYMRAIRPQDRQPVAGWTQRKAAEQKAAAQQAAAQAAAAKAKAPTPAPKAHAVTAASAAAPTGVLGMLAKWLGL